MKWSPSIVRASNGHVYQYIRRYCGAMSSTDCTLNRNNLCTDIIHQNLRVVEFHS